MKIYGAGTLHSNKLGVKQATSFLPSALHITDTKVIVNCPANYSGEWNGACVLDGNADVSYTASGDLAISGGNVEAKSEKSNGIYADGKLEISDGAKVNASGYYPALFGSGSVSIENSQIEATSTGDAGIFSRGDVSIQNSTVKVSEAENYYAVTARGTTTVTGSWVETNYENSVNGSITDSVLFNGNSGTVIGNAKLLGNTTLDAGKTLVIPEGASLSVGAGNTFTNNGTVTVEGSLSTEGGTLACYSHSGGTATCAAQAICDACRTPYGDKNPANHTALQHVDAKAATTEAEGNIEYWYCADCGKYYSDAAAANEITQAQTVTAKLMPESTATPTPAPTAAPAAAPAQTAAATATPKPTTAPTAAPTPTATPQVTATIPQTGDTGSVTLLLALLFLSGGACIGMAVSKKVKQ